MKTSYLVAVVSALFLLSACNEDPVSVPKQIIRPIKLTTVTQEYAEQMRSFPGTVAAAEISELSFRINGELAELAVLSGQRVKKGQVIGRLDDNDLQQDLKNQTADFDFAMSEYKRTESVYEQRLISRSQYEQSRTRMVEAESRLDKARNNLSYSVLKAPFDGIVSQVLVDSYQTITAKQPIVTLQGEDMVEVVIQMPENVVVNVREDANDVNYQPTVTFASITNSSFKATYKEHAAQANRGSQTYDVTFILPRPENFRVLPGMTATIHFDLSQILQIENSQRLVVDPRAVVSIDGNPGQFVWRYNDESGEVNAVQVNVGDLINEGIQIVEGVNAGDKVAVAGLHLLHDGMKVKPLAKQRGL